MREPVDIFDKNFYHRCRTVMAALQFLDAGGDVLVSGDEFTHADESLDD